MLSSATVGVIGHDPRSRTVSVAKWRPGPPRGRGLLRVALLPDISSIPPTAVQGSRAAEVGRWRYRASPDNTDWVLWRSRAVRSLGDLALRGGGSHAGGVQGTSCRVAVAALPNDARPTCQNSTPSRWSLTRS